MFYEIKLKVTKPDEKTGCEKEVTESFITNVGLFAETKGFSVYAGYQVDFAAIKRSNIIEIVNENEMDKPFYKATIVSTFVDEKKNDDIKCNQLDYYESNFSNYSCCLEKALQESLKYVGVN